MMQLIESAIKLAENKFGDNYTAENVSEYLMSLIGLTDPKNKISPFNKPFNN